MYRALIPLVLVGACGPQVPQSAPPPAIEPDPDPELVVRDAGTEPATLAITSEPAALERFDAIVASLLATTSGDQRARIQNMENARRAGQSTPPTTRQGPCAEDAATARSVLGPDRTALVGGSVEAAEEATGQQCWTVSLEAGFHALVVVIAADTGEMLLAWLPPEG